LFSYFLFGEDTKIFITHQAIGWKKESALVFATVKTQNQRIDGKTHNRLTINDAVSPRN
jgi:hypothetical protein